MTTETWYVHQDDADDNLGGWCVLSVDRPSRTLTGEDVAAGRRLIADFTNEADARRIVELHNAAVELGPVAYDVGFEKGWQAGYEQAERDFEAAGRLLPDGGETEHGWAIERCWPIPMRDEEEVARFLRDNPGSRAHRRQVGPWVEVTDAAG
jgi:hypothetical protein